MTNTMIIELYKIENNITCPLHTYTKWQELGYQVKQGEKSKHKIAIWKSCSKKVKDSKTETETISNKLIMKTASFFTINQVEAIKA